MPGLNALGLVALLVVGCTAEISRPGGSTLTRASASAGASSSAAGGRVSSGGTASCSGVDPGPSYIRRVTHLEYDNTVRDLLGQTGDAAASFPAEERGLGFDNNAASLSVSPALAEQYLAVSEKVATAAVSDMHGLVPCDPVAIGVDACAQQFIAAFGKRAYRRPLDADQLALLTSVFNVGKATDFSAGVRLVIETLLQTPQFLYRVEFGTAPGPSDPTVSVDVNGATQVTPVVRLTSWEMASRLSYQLWGTMPDAALFAAAEADQLQTRDQIRAQAQRMLRDLRARDSVAHFYDQWLRIGELDGVSKDSTLFPSYSPAIAGFMQQESRKFLDYVTWDGPGTLAGLLTAPVTFVNQQLAAYYGIPGVTGDAFVKVDLDPSVRGGILTQGGLLSLLAKSNQTGPVQRGKFVREQLLCTEMPPPPPGLEIKAPELSATLTTRQRFSQHAVSPTCSGCHHLMDPIGLGFEGFDAAGLARPIENGVAVDTSGNVLESDVAGPFNGPRELASKLAQSAQVTDCMTKKMFRYAYGRGETAIDACNLASLAQTLTSSGGKIEDLLLALTQTDAFLYRRSLPAAGGAP